MTPFLLAAEGFTWWGWLGQAIGHPEWADVPQYLIMGWVVAVVLFLISLCVRVSLSRRDPVIPPDPSEMDFVDWVRVSVDMVVDWWIERLDELMPHHHEGRGYLWLIAPIFLYVLVGNLMALLPGFEAPTASINANFAVAITVFVLYHAFGLRSSGLGYLRQFWAPRGVPWWIAPVIGALLMVIEIFSHAFRPVTLTLRLFGNMTGDHTTFTTFLRLVPLGVPVIFLAMGLLVSLIQAIVFALLSAIYVTLATSHDH